MGVRIYDYWKNSSSHELRPFLCDECKEGGDLYAQCYENEISTIKILMKNGGEILSENSLENILQTLNQSEVSSAEVQTTVSLFCGCSNNFQFRNGTCQLIDHYSHHCQEDEIFGINQCNKITNASPIEETICHEDDCSSVVAFEELCFNEEDTLDDECFECAHDIAEDVVRRFEVIKKNMFDEYRKKKKRKKRNTSDIIDDIFFFDTKWTYRIDSTKEYDDLKSKLIKDALPDDIEIPAYLELLESCSDCAVLDDSPDPEMVEEILSNFDPDKPDFSTLGDPMVDSLTGAMMDVDLCTAVNRQLILTLYAKGTAPFQGKVLGIPAELRPIVAVLINQDSPYNVTVTILNTDIWKESGQEFFFVNLKDSGGKEGSVYVKVSMDSCNKAAETDADLSLRANLKVVQASLIIKNLKKEEHESAVQISSEQIYAVLNGINALKSVEFETFRFADRSSCAPLSFPLDGVSLKSDGCTIRRDNHLQAKTEVDHRFRDKLDEPYEPTVFVREFGNIWFDCFTDECTILDFILTMYDTTMTFDGLSFDDSLFKGLNLASERTALLLNKENQVRAARPTRPIDFAQAQNIGNVLISLSVLYYLYCVYKLVFQSYSKSILWKLLNVVTLTLVVASVYMETQTFIYYLEGQGLMYSPTFVVVIFLGYLPIMIMIVLMLRGFVLVRYFRLWKTTSYYKLYPMQMIVLLINTIFHDLPEMILLYFYYTRYKPPSFDLRLTALANSFISLCVALIGTVTQSIGVYRYQKLFKMGPSKILIFISVLPVILVTPLMKISVLLSTIFSQMVTYTTGNTYDIKKHTLNDIQIVDGRTVMNITSTDNEFVPVTSAIQGTNIAKHALCVDTEIVFRNASFALNSEPEPFKSGCLNQLEWVLIGATPVLIMGLVSFIFLLRKAWPFLNIPCLCWGLCPADDRSYKRRPSAFAGLSLAMVNLFARIPERLQKPRESFIGLMRRSTLFVPEESHDNVSKARRSTIAASRPTVLEAIPSSSSPRKTVVITETLKSNEMRRPSILKMNSSAPELSEIRKRKSVLFDLQEAPESSSSEEEEENPIYKALREEDLIGFVDSDDDVKNVPCFVKIDKEEKKKSKKAKKSGKSKKKSKEEIVTSQPAPPLSAAEQKLIDDIYK
ncbi:Oidioi.mRNA.OKI2018_I69.chr1.g1314.t1.cds [Oikopleura dioica]|uniref:Oidioi.mRNA.OKI2018_I69.chr1.g1314.t1.cds n=1 Tax=Oikopleura dioica TaxID=34765 RepID=A0ABN7SMI8_OIKDI|nr:Oidioi.mRNA.OKI2018_I69.chr1.g1314.t1.cds [Oikopleura dioica]